MRNSRTFTWFILATAAVTIQSTGCSSYVTIPEVQAVQSTPFATPTLPPIPTSRIEITFPPVIETPAEMAPVVEPAATEVQPEQPAASPEIPAPQMSPTETQPAFPTIPPTPVFTPTYNLATVAPADPSKQPPLEINFPTAIPEEERDWRPPLYPIPWSLSSHDHFYFARPISADVVNWPLWNYRYGGTTPAWEGVVHTGIDIDAPLGTPVRAAAPGRVLWAGYGLYNGRYETKDPYGIAVTLVHDFGFEGEKLYTIYAHMSEADVQTNQMVNTGDILGLVGQTGATTGPHLHFEVRWKQNMFNSTLNPELWLAPPQGWGVLAGRVMNTSGSFYTSQDVTVMRSDKKQTWIVRTYGDKYVRSDPYYQENVVLSDLPAGNYIINIDYEKITYRYNITINAGAVSYFQFKGKEGFYSGMPKEAAGFSPAPE
jgi:murein DD-endopeptidase MepM/ murein hydrolase activator NlpD